MSISVPMSLRLLVLIQRAAKSPDHSKLIHLVINVFYRWAVQGYIWIE